MKLYKDMGADERLTYLQSLIDFNNGGMVALTAVDCPWDAECKAHFETALDLLGAFPQYAFFVDETRMFRDYARRVALLKAYMDDIKSILSQEAVVTTYDGRHIAYVDQKQETRRRGRPSREEMLREAKEQKGEGTSEQKSAIIESIAELVGATVVQRPADREKNNDELAAERAERKAEREKGQLDLFGSDNDDKDNGQNDNGTNDDNKVINETPDDNSEKIEELNDKVDDLDARVDELQEKLEQKADKPEEVEAGETNPQLLPLRMIAHLLKPAEAKLIDEMREQYATMTSNAETAKAMALAGSAPADVKPYAAAAKKAEERIEYIKLALDNAMVHALNNAAVQLNANELATLQAAAERIKERQEEGESVEIAPVKEAVDPEVKKKVAAIVKYLRRTDKPNTAARIKGMEQKMAELVELIGEEEASKYQPLLDDAKSHPSA